MTEDEMQAQVNYHVETGEWLCRETDKAIARNDRNVLLEMSARIHAEKQEICALMDKMED